MASPQHVEHEPHPLFLGLTDGGADGITEEQRLSALVAAVDDQCAVAPKGALLLDARHRVVQSPSFRGGIPPGNTSQKIRLCSLFVLLFTTIGKMSEPVAVSIPGLSSDQAMDLKSYVHWRQPKQADKIKVRETKGLTQTTDFLDTIHADEPAGCWSTIFEPSACLATLRSNVWPGFVGFASLSGPSYGYVYFGNGVKNSDIAFMLP